MKHYNTKQEIKSEVVRLLQERLALISVNPEKYNFVEEGKDERQRVLVTYDGINLLVVEPFISNVVENGRLKVSQMFSVNAIFDDYWYDNYDLNTSIYVDEYMICQFQNKLISFDELLDILFPFADNGKVKRICDELEKIGFKYVSVKYDTYTYKYVVEGDIHSFLYNENNEAKPKEDIQNKRLFKYMSFNTYIEMLKSKKIRLNSIMSMNDSSETFYLGDYLCKAYEDERRRVLHPKSRYFQDGGLRKKKVVEFKDNLIGCFSEKKDDALMWRLYGDGGKGVCLEFQIDNDTLKPVLYLDEKNQKAKLLTEIAGKLKNDGILLYNKDISNYHFYTKSHYYKDEGEWRIIMCTGDSELNIENYDGLISLYKDFNFEELGLIPTILYLGSNLAFKDVNVPLLVDLSKRNLNVRRVMMSRVDSIRV